MRSIIAALALAVPLASCGDEASTFGDGGWDGGSDIEEAVPLGDEPALRPPPPPVERPRERPERAQPEVEEPDEEAVEVPAVTPEPVVPAPSPPPPVEPSAPPAPETPDDKPPEA